MENNVNMVRESRELHEGAASLAQRSIELAERLLSTEPAGDVARGGRKAHRLISMRGNN